MRKSKICENGKAWVSPYHELIQKATGAPGEDLSLIENIMREEIFHSTLDWQTEGELIAAALEAQRRLNADREMYDLDLACRLALLELMRAETALREKPSKQNRHKMERAEKSSESAREKLSKCLELRQIE